MAAEIPIDPVAAVSIPVDLFVSKQQEGLSRSEIGFADSLGNLIFRVTKNSSSRNFIVVDQLGTSLFSVYRQNNGCWHVYRGADEVEKEMIFRVKRTVHKLCRTELEVFLVRENSEESTSNFNIKGCSYQRSCIIYGGNTILAQTSLMYKLHQIFVRRNRFRLTIFPGSLDHALVVTLVVIFLYG